MSIDPNVPSVPPQPVPVVLVREYRAMNRVGWQAVGLLAGGGVFVLMLLGYWALLLLSSNPSPSAGGRASGFIGGLAVIPIFMLIRGFWLLRSVVRVVVDPQGLWVEGFFSRKWIQWPQVHLIRRDKKSQLMGDSVELLTLLDAGGKVIIKLPDTLGYFNDLARDVTERSAAAQGRQTFDADADAARRKKSDVKKLRWAAWGAGFMTLVFGAIFVMGVYETIHVRRYATEGVRTDARILRRHMISVTPYVKYEFKDENGRVFERDAMMQRWAWDGLAGSRTVPVEYLPSDPSWNRVILGEDKGATLGGWFTLLSGGMTLVLAGITVSSSLGYDLNTDGGKLQITRYGRPLGETPPAV